MTEIFSYYAKWQVTHFDCNIYKPYGCNASAAIEGKHTDHKLYSISDGLQLVQLFHNRIYMFSFLLLQRQLGCIVLVSYNVFKKHSVILTSKLLKLSSLAEMKACIRVVAALFVISGMNVN